MKTGEDFKKQAKDHNLTSWPIRPCTFCEVEIGYEFRNGEPFFNSSCGCGLPPSPLQPRTWDAVAKQYNTQTSPKVIEKMDEFWHFETVKAD